MMGADIRLDDFGGDKKNDPGAVLFIDGIKVPPEKIEEVIRILEADKGLPPFQTDKQIKDIFSGER